MKRRINPSNEDLFKLLYELYICSWYVDRNKCIEIVKHVNTLLQFPDIKNKLVESIDHHLSNFDLILPMLSFPKKICVLKETTEEELNDLCQQGQVFYYVQKEKNYVSPNFLLTANPVIRSIERKLNIQYNEVIE